MTEGVEENQGQDVKIADLLPGDVTMYYVGSNLPSSLDFVLQVHTTNDANDGRRITFTFLEVWLGYNQPLEPRIRIAGPFLIHDSLSSASRTLVSRWHRIL